MSDDYAEDLALTAPDAAAMQNVLDLARKQWRITHEISDMEAALKSKKEEFRKISEMDLPEAMSLVGVAEQPLSAGYKVVLSDTYFASIPKELSEQAHRWLDDNGHGSMIKHDVKIHFDRGEGEWFDEFMQSLAQRNKPLDMEVKEGVHHQTLNAFVREQLRKGEYLPVDLLGIYQKRCAEIVAPKKKTEF